MASISKRDNGSWLARYRPVVGGTQKYRTFSRKVDAQRWIDETTASIVMGQYVDPKTARTTVEQWCATWLEGYKSRGCPASRGTSVAVDVVVRRRSRVHHVAR